MVVEGATPTSTSWHGHTQIRIDESLSSRWNDRLLRRIQIITGRKRASPSWQLRLVTELLDQKMWAVLHLGDRNRHVVWFGSGGWNHSVVI